ncbi:uncharacterized protein DS421_3g81160 [Arachis hypogaea]|nr:uncharacterized protein DS421_3g81160 [Arachis hypogaea]
MKPSKKTGEKSISSKGNSINSKIGDKTYHKDPNSSALEWEMLEYMRRIQPQKRDAFEAKIMAGCVLENHVINNIILNQKPPITSNPMPPTSGIVLIPNKPPDEKREIWWLARI